MLHHFIKILHGIGQTIFPSMLDMRASNLLGLLTLVKTQRPVPKGTIPLGPVAYAWRQCTQAQSRPLSICRAIFNRLHGWCMNPRTQS